MDITKLVWGFSPFKNILYGKSFPCSLVQKEITTYFDVTSDIIDLAYTSPKIYILKNSSLYSIDIHKSVIKKHDLKLNIYLGLIPVSNHILILSKNSLKFSISSKLCRKINISIQQDQHLISKCSMNNEIYLLINQTDKKNNSLIFRYSYSSNTINTINLSYRLNVFSNACSVV